MLITPVVNLLKQNILSLTTDFCDTFTSATVTISGTEATFTFASAHQIADQEYVVIAENYGKIPVTSITRLGTRATVTLPSSHDLTVGHSIFGEITGADQTEYNGTVDLLEVISPTMYTCVVSNSPVTPATGTIYHKTKYNAMNGLHQITKLTDTSFKIDFGYTPNLPFIDNQVTFRKNPRISAVFQDPIDVSFVKHLPNNFRSKGSYIFVRPMPSVTSRDKNLLFDASSYALDGLDQRFKIVDSVEVTIFTSSYNQDKKDTHLYDQAQEHLSYVCKSLIGYKPETPYQEGYALSGLSPVNFISEPLEKPGSGIFYSKILFECRFDIVNEDTSYALQPTASIKSIEISDSPYYS